MIGAFFFALQEQFRKMIGYYIVRAFVALLRWMTFRWIYRFSDVLYFFIYRVVGYRKSVVRQNIRKAFPDIDKGEARKIERDFYHFFCDLFLETFKGISMTRKQLTRRYKVLHKEVMREFEREGTGAIICSGHLGNWEWGATSLCTHTLRPMVGIFKPIKNQRLNDYFKETRSRFGIHLAATTETGQAFKRFVGKKAYFMLVGDQNPSNLERAYWVDFFGSRLPALHGIEYYARRFDLPVIYFAIRPVRRGHYEIVPEILVRHPNELAEGEITQIYMKRLEEEIRLYPGYFIWSHKRWKHEGKEPKN